MREKKIQAYFMHVSQFNSRIFAFTAFCSIFLAPVTSSTERQYECKFLDTITLVLLYATLQKGRAISLASELRGKLYAVFSVFFRESFKENTKSLVEYLREHNSNCMKHVSQKYTFTHS